LKDREEDELELDDEEEEKDKEFRLGCELIGKIYVELD
jgi:hypothetical protein